MTRVVTRFLTEHGDMFEVFTSLLLRSTPFTIFSGPIRFRIRKRWKVLKSVEKVGLAIFMKIKKF